MRKRQLDRERDGVPGPDISSLVDVSFLLLIYFLITSTLDPRESDLGLTMPGLPDGKTPVVALDHPVIEIDAAGVVSMSSEVLETNPDSRTLVHLQDRLRTWTEAARLRRDGIPIRIELKVDDAVSGQRFVDVLNCLAGVGISEIALDDFRARAAPNP